MKTTITEKFDAEGKLIERVTVTESLLDQLYPLQPNYAPAYPMQPPFEITWSSRNVGVANQ